MGQDVSALFSERVGSKTKFAAHYSAMDQQLPTLLNFLFRGFTYIMGRKKEELFSLSPLGKLITKTSTFHAFCIAGRHERG